LSKLFDIIFIIVGAFLSPWALYKWSEINFKLEGKFDSGNRDGAFLLSATLMGIGLACYGLWDLIVLQKKQRADDPN
jgi:hypothetical protein